MLEFNKIKSLGSGKGTESGIYCVFDDDMNFFRIALFKSSTRKWYDNSPEHKMIPANQITHYAMLMSYADIKSNVDVEKIFEKNGLVKGSPDKKKVNCVVFDPEYSTLNVATFVRGLSDDRFKYRDETYGETYEVRAPAYYIELPDRP